MSTHTKNSGGSWNSYIGKESQNEFQLIGKPMKVVSIISFGPIESRSNGYFIRVWNMLKALSKFNGLKLIVLEFPEYEVDRRIKVINNIIFIRLRGNEVSRSRISRTIKKVLTFDPFHVIKFQILSLYELLKYRRLIAKSDAVMIEGSLLIMALLISKLLGKKIILDTHCVNKLLAKNIKNINKLIYVLRTIAWDLLERVGARLSDLVITVSTEERIFVIKEYGVDPHRTLVVPNVIEPPKEVAQETIENLRKSLKLENKIVLIFVGNLESVQNADAVNYIVNELAPWIWRKQKDIVFLIVGKGAEKFQCNSPNVIFTGFVKDLAPYLAMSDACIAPLRVGAGTKTKILECLAYRKMIITTPVGIEGLENIVKEAKHVIVADINSFKETLLNVIEELKKGEIKEFKQNSIVYLEEMYRSFYSSIEKVVEQILSKYNENIENL